MAMPAQEPLSMVRCRIAEAATQGFPEYVPPRGHHYGVRSSNYRGKHDNEDGLLNIARIDSEKLIIRTAF